MSHRLLLEAAANALDAASSSLRQRIALLDAEDENDDPGTAPVVVSRAKALHPSLGPRQAEVLEALAEAGKTGTSTGVISRAIDYDQPNVYLTLQRLVDLGFVQKNETTDPHTYWLTGKLAEGQIDPELG